MKAKLAKLKADILHMRSHRNMDVDLNAWDVLGLLEQLVDDLVAIYGKPEEADEG